MTRYSHSDASTTDDCGDDTSTYNGENDKNRKSRTNSTPDYLAKLKSSSSQSSQAKTKEIIDLTIAYTAPNPNPNTTFASIAATNPNIDPVAVQDAIDRQEVALSRFSTKKRAKNPNHDPEDAAAKSKKIREAAKEKKKAAKKAEKQREKIRKIRDEHTFTLTQYERDNIAEDTHESPTSSSVKIKVENNTSTDVDMKPLQKKSSSRNQVLTTPETSSKKKSSVAFSVSAPVPVTDEKKETNHAPAAAIESETNKQEEDSLVNSPKKRSNCKLCRDSSKFCHSDDFGGYCIMYTQNQFRLNPGSWTRKLSTQAFLKAYNRILDYVKFRRSKSKTLIPHATYFPPACLKEDLDWVIADIRDDTAELHAGDKTEIVVDVNWLEKENLIRKKNTIRGKVNPHSIDSEIADKLEADPSNCPHCYLHHSDCHDTLFGEYCKAKVVRYSSLFPTSMTRPNARTVFLKYYQAALHVLIWVKYEHVADESVFVYPPACLEATMDEVTNQIDLKHSENLDKRNWTNVSEWNETRMDFEGMDTGMI